MNYRLYKMPAESNPAATSRRLGASYSLIVLLMVIITFVALINAASATSSSTAWRLSHTAKQGVAVVTIVLWVALFLSPALAPCGADQQKPHSSRHAQLQASAQAPLLLDSSASQQPPNLAANPANATSIWAALVTTDCWLLLLMVFVFSGCISTVSVNLAQIFQALNPAHYTQDTPIAISIYAVASTTARLLTPALFR